MKYQRLLVTSALPYANGPVHLGHLAGAYLPADIYVRYHRLKGTEVLYICGTDEYGTTITESARKQGTTPQAIADRYHQVIREAFAGVGISFDNFSRTSRPVHTRQTQEFFLRLYEKGLLKQKTEQQLYDPQIGQFLADRQVVGTCHHCGYEKAYADQCESCGKAIDPRQLKNPRSLLSGATPEVRETTHWYFPLGEWQPQLEEWLENKSHWKPNVLNFCRNYFAEGLQDRAITRDLDWGVPVPLRGWEGKVLYVWFDAPIGYISSTIEWAEQIGQPDQWKEYWCDREGTKLVHFIGKDNIFFHALLFPAMCMAYGNYVLASEVPANEFLNLEGDKFSTSRGWAVWLHEYLQRFDPDPLRYYLTCIMPELADSDFVWRDFQERNNAELADTLGNFVQRALTFVHRYFAGQVPAAGSLREADRALLAAAATAPALLGEALERFEFKKAVRTLMDLPQAGNVYFQQQAPWEVRKTDPARCGTILNTCLQVCRTLAVVMFPFLPFAAEKLWRQLNLPGKVEEQSWDKAGEPLVPVGHPLNRPEILFPKIEDERIEAEVARLHAAAAEAAQGEEKKPMSVKPPAELISPAEFSRLDLRIARVEAAERVPGTDRLLKLKINLGEERRQIVAGLAHIYPPEEMVGKLIVVVANLQPARIRGVESQGMLLAAQEGEDIVLLIPESDIAPGAKVR
ncbi:MAG TPA: methionine--tRNA ligase [Armatimonadetes bacterium]|nr:methionine--tRNA ligase [Armatimonadota bacterium]